MFEPTNRPLTVHDTQVRLSYTENGVTATTDISITVTGGTGTGDETNAFTYNGQTFAITKIDYSSVLRPDLSSANPVYMHSMRIWTGDTHYSNLILFNGSAQLDTRAYVTNPVAAFGTADCVLNFGSGQITLLPEHPVRTVINADNTVRIEFTNVPTSTGGSASLLYEGTL